MLASGRVRWARSSPASNDPTSSTSTVSVPGPSYVPKVRDSFPPRILQTPASRHILRERKGARSPPGARQQRDHRQYRGTPADPHSPLFLHDRQSIGYKGKLLLTLFHDQPAGASQEHFDRFQKEDVLARLHAIDERARRQGLAALDPNSDPLIPLGMEIDADGRVTELLRRFQSELAGRASSGMGRSREHRSPRDSATACRRLTAPGCGT